MTEKGKDFQNAQGLYNEILSSREKIECTASGRKKRETLLWKGFETSYRKDLYHSIARVIFEGSNLKFCDFCRYQLTENLYNPQNKLVQLMMGMISSSSMDMKFTRNFIMLIGI